MSDIGNVLKVCVIFNKDNKEVVRAYLSEEECFRKYNEEFDDSHEYYDWRVINLNYVLEMILFNE